MKECFTADKVSKYHNGLAGHPDCTPQMYFIASPKKRGQAPGKCIIELEELLIKVAYLKNPDIENSQNIPGVTVEGLIGRTNGTISKAVHHLKCALSLTIDDPQNVYS